MTWKFCKKIPVPVSIVWISMEVYSPHFEGKLSTTLPSHRIGIWAVPPRCHLTQGIGIWAHLINIVRMRKSSCRRPAFYWFQNGWNALCVSIGVGGLCPSTFWRHACTKSCVGHQQTRRPVGKIRLIGKSDSPWEKIKWRCPALMRKNICLIFNLHALPPLVVGTIVSPHTSFLFSTHRASKVGLRKWE